MGRSCPAQPHLGPAPASLLGPGAVFKLSPSPLLSFISLMLPLDFPFVAHVEDSSLGAVCWDSDPVILQLGWVTWCLCWLEKRRSSQPVLRSDK